MKNYSKFFLIAFLISGFIACEKESDTAPEHEIELTPKQIELPARSDELIQGSNDFGIELFSKVAIEDEDNMMLSPLSASVALTMLLNGCDGDTYIQIRDMLGYPADMEVDDINDAYRELVSQLLQVDPKVTLKLANAIFYRLDFDVKQSFLNIMSNYFDAHIEGLDFTLASSVDVINEWASDNTNEKIPQVIEEIDDLMVMFIMNALYFKGDWSYQFDKDETKDRPFHLDNDMVISVSTMAGNVMAKQYSDDGLSVIELPYGKSNYSMVVVVPDSSLNDFYNDFTPGMWKDITDSLDEHYQWAEKEVYMPKFEFEYEKLLNAHLQSLGMIDAFDPNIADLSGIADPTSFPDNLFVDFVKQNTFIEVNEEGTEAAAVTTIGVGLVSVDGPTRFFIDKPFIFSIRERTTNTLLFIGSVVNPE